VKEGLVKRTWGNISLRVDENHMLITPSSRRYEDLSTQDIVMVIYPTSEYKCSVKPSSEMGLPAKIYLTRKDVNAVIHNHQPNASTVVAAWRFNAPGLYSKNK